MITPDRDRFDLYARVTPGLPGSMTLVATTTSAAIYGDVDKRHAFACVNQIPRLPNTKPHLLGKPETSTCRRMGVTLAFAQDADTAGAEAKACASAAEPIKE